MEIHHSHHSAHKKNWKEFIVEFFMLFLAVTLGFFAENIREHYVEHERAEKYLLQLMADLKQDTIKINSCNDFKTIKERQADSLVELLNSKDISQHTREIYYYSRMMPIREPFYGTEGTLNQLQNAGGFRIINNDEIVQLINSYIAAKEKINQIQDMQDFSSLQMRSSSNKIFDSRIENEMLNIHSNSSYRYFIKPIKENMPLASYDKTSINDYCNWVVWMMTSEKYNYVLLEQLKTRATGLILKIKQELGEG